MLKKEKLINLSSRSVPIWFMRQAGRYLPEYHVLRNKQRSFLETCFDPEVAAEISLQPIKRFNFDFIILFADILLIPHSLGQNVNFKEGIGPVLNKFDLNKTNCNSNNQALHILSPVYETIKIIKSKKLSQKVIGFCGGPFTVLTYMIECGSSKKHEKTMLFLKSNPNLAKYWIKKITELSIEYLLGQINAGADIVKVFDSWAGLLNEKEYEEYIIKPNKEIFNIIKKQKKEIQMIFFPRKSKKHIELFLREIKCDIIAIDQDLSDKDKNYCKKNDIIIQGNLSPQSLLDGGEKMLVEVKQIMEKYKENKHIFNLSHGVLPKTPIENVKKVVELVKGYEFTKRTSKNT